MQRPPRTVFRGLGALSLLVLAGCALPRTSSEGGPRPWRRRLIEPLTAPTIFESPVIDTQLRPMAMIQSLPSDSIFGGGSVNVYALQARLAVTDRLALIATKDGYVDLSPDAGADEDGMADIAAGLKYAVIDDPEAGLLVTPGAIFEFASGDEEVFQGNGDGLLRLFLSGGYDLDQLNVLAAAGYNMPLDGDAESTSFDWHGHVSWELLERLAPLIEIHGITWIDGGEALAADFEGGDLINLGATDPDGTVITGAFGLRYAATDALSLGAGYEIPITSREDLFDDRITIDIVLGF